MMNQALSIQESRELPVDDHQLPLDSFDDSDEVWSRFLATISATRDYSEELESKEYQEPKHGILVHLSSWCYRLGDLLNPL